MADSTPVGAADGGARFYSFLSDLGMTENRITIRWNPARPALIPQQDGLARAVEQAKDHDVQITFSIGLARAAALRTEVARTRFVTFLQLLASAFPDVTSFVVGNEFNQPRFYQPQFGPRCRPVSGGRYARLLANAYDALKAVNEDITVISSVSPHGNDDCHAKSNVSTSPVRFIRDMGAAYRALHRDLPIFDEFGIHLYPNQPTDSLTKQYAWPTIGAGTLARVKQALWDAFHGTAQPVPDWQPAALRYGKSIAELEPARLWIGEVGWQVRAIRRHGPYRGRENVRVTSEARQARIYAQMVRRASCDKLVDSALFFGLADERDLARFQAGLLRADWTKRPSYRAVRSAIAAAGSGCQGRLVRWHHATGVVGARANFGRPGRGLTLTAREDATAEAGVFAAGGRQLSEERRAAIVRSLGGGGGLRAILRTRARIRANWPALLRFSARRLGAGTYVYAVRIKAAMNPGRTTTFVGRPFSIGLR